MLTKWINKCKSFFFFRKFSLRSIRTFANSSPLNKRTKQTLFYSEETLLLHRDSCLPKWKNLNKRKIDIKQTKKESRKKKEFKIGESFKVFSPLYGMLGPGEGVPQKQGFPQSGSSTPHPTSSTNFNNTQPQI